MKVTPLISSKPIARPVPQRPAPKKKTDPRYEPLLIEKDYRPLKIVLRIAGRLLIGLGIVGILSVLIFPGLALSLGTRRGTVLIVGSLFVVLGSLLLFGKKYVDSLT